MRTRLIVMLTLLLVFLSALSPPTLPADDDSAAGSGSPSPKEQNSEQLVDLVWGVPGEVEMGAFEGLQRRPEDSRSRPERPDMEVPDEAPEEDAARAGGTQLELVWDQDQSYVLPLFASSEHTLDGIRYFGHSVPLSFEVEWLDVRTRRWYPIEDIPSELILMRSKRQNDHRTIEFGPPEGAAFRHDKVRFIWFRVTPREPGEFSLVLFAFQPNNAPQDHEHPTPISDELILEAKVRALQD